MAIVICDGCGAIISDRSNPCGHCGTPNFIGINQESYGRRRSEIRWMLHWVMICSGVVWLALDNMDVVGILTSAAIFTTALIVRFYN